MASVSKYFSTSFLMTREVAGHISVGLIKQQLPAVIAFIKGLTVTATGTFQVPYIATTPRGSYTAAVVPGARYSSVSKGITLDH